MAEAMLRILNDPDQARRMGLAGRRRVEERYDQRATTRALEQLYEELCGDRARQVA
jgi:glycosyltransferase involved in cell wall biosynthesis